MAQTVAASVRTPSELMDRYTRLAKDTGRPRSYYINEALFDSIERLEYEYGILRKVEDWRAGRLETVTLDDLEEDLDLAD